MNCEKTLLLLKSNYEIAILKYLQKTKLQILYHLSILNIFYMNYNVLKKDSYFNLKKGNELTVMCYLNMDNYVHIDPEGGEIGVLITLVLKV